jgi:DNA polymerase III delta prime subunit
MSEPRPLLSELLRPQQLGDLTLPQNVIDKLQRIVSNGSIPNMLFYGQPGMGKTSAARIIVKDLGPGRSTEINGSSATGIDFVRQRIEGFAFTVCMYGGGPKVCFIDEAEFVSKQAQAALRKVIENTSSNCRFIFAVNDRHKLIPALDSRLLPICFDVAPNERSEVIGKLISRYTTKLAGLKIELDPLRLAQIVGIYYPDLRRIANTIEFDIA